MSVALSVAPPVTVPVMLFSGYYLNLRSVPRWLNWCPYLSWLRYGMEGWMIVQWRDIGEIECVGGGGNMTCMSSGAQVLKYFEYPEVSDGCKLICRLVTKQSDIFQCVGQSLVGLYWLGGVVHCVPGGRLCDAGVSSGER